MEKIFVTGVDGFVGKYLVKDLIKKGYSVSGTAFSFTDKQDYKLLSSVATIKLIDLLDINKLSDFLLIENPNAIIHLAAQSSIPSSWENPNHTYSTNVIGTNNLFKCIEKANLGGIPILVVGAAAEYGHVKSNGDPIDENDHFFPDNPYAVSKVASEMIAYQYYISHNFHTIRARPFTHVGSGQDERFVCSEFSKKIASIEKNLISNEIKVGDLSIQRDFLDVRDVVNAYELMIRKSNAGSVYNVSSNKGTSIGEVLDILIGFSSKRIKIIKDPQKFRENEANSIVGNNSKLMKELNWEAKYKLEETLLEILNHWRNIV
jgi:GDP-4-dehydro-6-deoxy-D-mannose reductase